eukprot:922262-Pelagomonas_calceolata.AAC.7
MTAHHAVKRMAVNRMPKGWMPYGFSAWDLWPACQMAGVKRGSLYEEHRVRCCDEGNCVNSS